MDRSLQENIRRCRKERGLTQAQLAEAMGVTVGAVSKWESGASVPDLETLMNLARFYQWSVDALLGFRPAQMGAEELVRRIKDCTVRGDLEQGIPLTEEALQRYPNRFDVVYRCAQLFLASGVTKNEQESQRRALELFQQAEGLLPQNADPAIGRRTLRLAIGQCLVGLGRRQEALDTLSACNEDGVNNYLIGNMLEVMGRREEARKVLAESMLDCVNRLINTTVGMANCLARGDGNHAAALEQLRWLVALLDSLSPGVPFYLDKLSATLLTACASLRVSMGDLSGAENYLKSARNRAEKFDSAPDQRVSQMKFYQGREAAWYDEFGKTAREGILHTIFQQDENAPALLEIWKKLDAVSAQDS